MAGAKMRLPSRPLRSSRRVPTARLGHWASAFDAVDGSRESATALAAASWISIG